MSIEVLNCQRCGAPLKIVSSTCECDYCGSINIIGGDAGKYINQLNRANKLRQQCEFDHAYTVYDIILSENSPSVDVLWSQALCEYGIEYVPDPISSKYFPTLHRIKDESFLNSRCYTEALELADDEQKEELISAAKEIAQIQERYLNIASNEKPYDVFICYKEKDTDTGEYTDDVALAEELYKELTSNGYKVFFAGESLKDKLSIDYEPYIFAALKSAKAMAVIGTKAEYFTSVWVKNEWGRFLKLMETNPEKNIFFACDDPEELPRAFASKQSQLLSQDGAIKNLAYNIVKFLRDSKTNKRTSKVLTAQDAFDRVMAVQAKEYLKNIEKTHFREKERNIKKELWTSGGAAITATKFYNSTYHIGSAIIIAAQLFYIFYAGIRKIDSEIEYMGPEYIFGAVLLIAILSGATILLASSMLDSYYNTKKKGAEETSFIIPAIILCVIMVGWIVFLFIFTLFPYVDTVFVIASTLLIIFVGLIRWINPAFKLNQDAFSDVSSKNRELQKLEEYAKEEFLKYEENLLEEFKQSNPDSDAEIKDYHYDDIKPVVRNIIEEDYRLIQGMEKDRLDVPSKNKMRMLYTLIYGSVSAMVTVIDIIIFYTSFSV